MDPVWMRSGSRAATWSRRRPHHGGRTMRLRWSSGEVVGWIVAVAGPTVLTAALAAWGGHERRDYAFLYLGLVAVLGVLCGPGPVVVATALSILLVDLFLVPPVLTLTIADGRDVVDVLAFA